MKEYTLCTLSQLESVTALFFITFKGKFSSFFKCVHGCLCQQVFFVQWIAPHLHRLTWIHICHIFIYPFVLFYILIKTPLGGLSWTLKMCADCFPDRLYSSFASLTSTTKSSDPADSCSVCFVCVCVRVCGVCYNLHDSHSHRKWSWIELMVQLVTAVMNL